MENVNIIGAYSTTFSHKPETGYKALTEEAYLGVLADADMAEGTDIDFAWFGSCNMHSYGQIVIRGQVCFTKLVKDGLFPARVPIANIDNACATSSTALNAACKDILSGESDLVLIIGVDKLYCQDKSKTFELFKGGIDQLDHNDWQQYFEDAARVTDKAFETGSDRSIFMDTYAMQACFHMQKYGTTPQQIAIAAAKSHNFGALNDKAHYRFEMTPEQVLEDRAVSYPLTRSMCAPISDGAAALLVCSDRYLKKCSAKTQERSIKIRACAMSGGIYRNFDEPGLSAIAANRAYDSAELSPDDIDIAEVHDATSFSELYQAEMLGFCDYGQGGHFIEEGKAHQGGSIPMNTSGGLISKGHPVGATGASQVYELALQLRGEAGARQVKDARIGLAENGGGVMGFDEAVCVVTILERQQ